MKRQSALLLVLAIVYILSMMSYYLYGILEVASGGHGRWGPLKIYFRLTLPGSVVSLVSLVLPWRDSEVILLALAPILNVLLVLLLSRLWRARRKQASARN